MKKFMHRVPWRDAITWPNCERLSYALVDAAYEAVNKAITGFRELDESGLDSQCRIEIDGADFVVTIEWEDKMYDESSCDPSDPHFFDYFSVKDVEYLLWLVVRDIDEWEVSTLPAKDRVRIMESLRGLLSMI